MKKAIMIGLDGMPWHILNRLFRQNAMPNLKEITDKSVSGTLKSTIPPVSATAWTSIATGVNPGKHGIFGFTKFNDKAETRVLNSRDVRYLRVHEMVAVQGLTSICVNQMLTYPIKNISKAYVITDWMSPDTTFSPEIAKYAKDYHGATLTEPLPQRDLAEEYKALSSRVDTVNKLLENMEWDLFWAVYSEPDHLFHRYYDLVVNADRRVMKLFRKIDETFERAKEIADLIIVISDHGFDMFTQAVYINSYLSKYGLIEKQSRRVMKDLMDHRRIDERRVKLPLPEGFYRYLHSLPKEVEWLLTKVYSKLVKSGIKARLTTYVDPRRSEAFAYGFGVYVKDRTSVGYVMDILEKAPFIGDVWRRENLYAGRWVKEMPDLIVMPKFDEGFSFRSDVIAPKPIIRRDFSGHHPDGIAIVYKDKIESVWTNRMNICDIAPTILDFLGLEVPEDTDGRTIDF